MHEKGCEKPEEVMMGEPDESGEQEQTGEDNDLFGEAKEGEAEGEVEVIDDAEAEAEMGPKWVSPDPGLPTQSEVDDHNVDHLPYRCWCEDCVRGRGIGEQHRAGECSAIPVIAFDYLFITKGRILRREELDEETSKSVTMKILVVKDTKSKTVFAHTVMQKGVDSEGYAVTRLIEDVKWLGYTKVILKADNERAIVRLLKESLRRIKTETVDQVAQEHPPPYDSRSNGSIENCIRQVQGHLRTMKFSFERKVQSKVPDGHIVLSWLVEHVAWLLTARTRGEDGKTAYQRIRGRAFTRRLLEFGERCLYKLPMKGPRHDERGKLQERWRRGIFLGFARYTNEYILWDDGAVVKSRCHQRMSRNLRWPAGAHEKIDKDPHSTYAPMEPEMFEPGEAQAPAEVAQGRGPQTIQIRKADWERHGSTPGCSKCHHLAVHGWGPSSGSHSPECVERYKKAYEETEEGKLRLQRAHVRLERRRPPGEVEAGRPMDVGPEGGKHPLLEKFLQERRDDEARAEASPDYEATEKGDDDMAEPDEEDRPDMAVDEDETPCAEILEIVEAVGGSAKKYRREYRSRMRAVVSEVYSPPRVTACAKLLPGWGIAPGFAFDVTTTDENGVYWDFDIRERREEARRRLLEQKPMFLIGSPMCRAFSTWQTLNETRRDPELVRKEFTKAMIHLQFMCELYEAQVTAGRYFLHEHPSGATSWTTPCVQRILAMKGVDRVVGDQCQLGQRSHDGQPVKKPTGWMSNSSCVLTELERRCLGQGGMCSTGERHRPCSGRRTCRDAAIYPKRLCRAILRGFRRQLQDDGVLRPGTIGIHQFEDEYLQHILMEDVEATFNVKVDDQAQDAATSDDSCMESREGSRLPADEPAVAKLQTARAKGEKIYRDAITSQILIPHLVEEARREELEYFASKGVWYKRTRSEAMARTGRKPITVKWLDVNKGDDENPRYRSRLVARELRMPGEESIFAPTPPLESLRTVLSMAATNLKDMKRHVRDPDSEMRTQISVIDISRAYFNAKKDADKDPTYVDLPAEDPDREKGLCGLLRVHMYGTRAAADGWHCEYADHLTSMGFLKGDASACVFRHPEKGLVTSVHGDDFTTAGPKVHIDWMKARLQEKYELTEEGRLGPGRRDSKSLKILNRIVHWSSEGITYEADPRQAERVVVDLGLEGAKPVGSPGVKATAEMNAKDAPLPGHQVTAFRAVAARCNYLAADRPEAQFASKEICRWMANPSVMGLQALKRLGRFLEGHKRVVWEFPFQDAEDVEVYSDTDWAGCVRTRKSTSGGCLMIGSHLIKSWSSTQGLVSLSSGEAEFYGVTKASGIALGYKSLLKDLGVKAKVRVWTDSSATMGICGRLGLGKLRHIDTRSLWLQQKLREGALELRKVRGENNPADLFTKHLSSPEKIVGLMKLMGCRYADGRAHAAPQLRRDVSSHNEGILSIDVSQVTDGDQVQQDGRVYPGVTFEGELVPEAYLYDMATLPHQVKGDFRRLFPRAVPADETPEAREDDDWLERRGGQMI